MYLNLFFSVLILVFMSGCSFIQQEQTKFDDKKFLYQKVQNEITDYKTQGDILYNKGYYGDAAKAYEMVNFYEDKTVIPLSKISSIHNHANLSAKEHYEKAMKYLKKNKLLALFEFNNVMHNNPEYKDGKIQYENLKDSSEIKPLLEKMEDNLKKVIHEDISKIQTIKKINEASDKLAKYDYKNPTVIKANNILKKQHTILFDKATELYRKGNFELAEKDFKHIETIYPNDDTCKKYLSDIYAKKNFVVILKKAEEAMKNEDYSLVIALCEKALKYEPYNKQASTLVETVKIEYEKQIPELILKGKTLYYQQNFKESKNIFKSVLDFDANNSTALTYIKKIN